MKKNSEDYFFDDIPNETFIFDPDTLKIIGSNCIVEQKLGYTSDELRNMSALDLISKTEHKQYLDKLLLLINQNKLQIKINTSFYCKDGTHYFTNIFIQLITLNGKKYCLAQSINPSIQNINKNYINEEAEEINVILNGLQDAVIILDSDGKVTFRNLKAQQMFGYSDSEIIGKDLSHIIMSYDVLYDQYIKMINNFGSSGSTDSFGKRFEFTVKHKDNTEVYVSLSLSAVKTKSGWHIIGILRDISDLKKIMIELENKRKEYLQLSENAPIGITCCDLKGNITYVNPRALTILGSKSIEETKKINLTEFPLLVKYGVANKLIDCMVNNVSDIYEIKYMSKWGKSLWLKLYLKPLEENGYINGAQLLFDDITEKKQLEIEKKAKDERLQMMLKGIPRPAWLISEDYVILSQNKVAEKLLHKKVGEVCGIDKNKASFFQFENIKDKNISINFEYKINNAIWNTWWIPLGESIYLYYAEDVTKYKTIEEKLLKLSATDSLTGLYNRRYFMEKLEEKIESAKLNNETLSLIMVDLDHFKDINDMYGHNVGDIVLKKISDEMVKNQIKKNEIIARWGGEEFVILLPEISLDNAIKFAELASGIAKPV